MYWNDHTSSIRLVGNCADVEVALWKDPHFQGEYLGIHVTYGPTEYAVMPPGWNNEGPPTDLPSDYHLRGPGNEWILRGDTYADPYLTIRRDPVPPVSWEQTFHLTELSDAKFGLRSHDRSVYDNYNQGGVWPSLPETSGGGLGECTPQPIRRRPPQNKTPGLLITWDRAS